MTRIHLFAVTAILFIGVGCSGSPDGAGAKPVDTGPASPAGPAAAAAPTHPDPAVAAATRLASEAAARLAETLSSTLSKALAEGGPERAVGVCADVAQEVSARVSAESRASVRRTALRLRNPGNAPDDFERAALEAWSRPGATRDPITAVVAGPAGGRELRLLKPIVLQPLCVTCHGPAEEIPAQVRAAIAARYPEDRATGFRPGDLRGALSVRVPIAAEEAR